MVAFAANSVLCRMALAETEIDASTFTLVRLGAGAAMLYAVLRVRGLSVPRRKTWVGPIALFAYAICFSYAYRFLNAGTGALILFGAVQITLMVSALRAGERLSGPQWTGFAAAAAGLFYLLSPGIQAPSPVGGALMAVSGAAWGIYTLEGRGGSDPTSLTSENFIRAVPIAVVASLLAIFQAKLDLEGVAYAVLSGAVTSGLGYVLWYTALRGLTTATAAIVQLSVPVIAASGGVLFLSERITPRLLLSSVLVLGGIALAVTTRRSQPASTARS